MPTLEDPPPVSYGQPSPVMVARRTVATTSGVAITDNPNTSATSKEKSYSSRLPYSEVEQEDKVVSIFADTSGLDAMLEDLESIKEEEPEFPLSHIQEMESLLRRTAHALSFPLPYGSPGIMEDGALRVDWRYKDKDVSLVLQGDSAVPSYIHIFLAPTLSSSVEDNVSVFNLSHKLEWLVQ